jgi:microcystin-dependent protein
MNALFDGRIRRKNVEPAAPSGTIITHVSVKHFPDGWLPCWGQAVSRARYSKLFAVLGYSFGAGDEAGETFNLPDLRGQTTMGYGKYRPVGATGGSDTQTLTEANLAPHSHSGTTSTDGSHTHSSNADGSPYSLSTYNGSNTAGGDLDTSSGEPNLFAGPVALSINSAGSHNHTFTTNSKGSGTAFSILQPYLVVNHLIKI